MDQEYWDEAYRDDPDQSSVEDYFLKEEIEDLPPGFAIDLGCGTGHNALMLAERGWQVIGVDFVSEAITIARQAALDRGLQADFITADITTWQPPIQCDLVIFAYALPGGKDNKLAIRTAVKCLAGGGTLIIIEWDKSMTSVWGIGDDDLMSVDELVAHLSTLVIEQSEVRRIDNPFPGTGPDQVNVAFIRAVRG